MKTDLKLGYYAQAPFVVYQNEPYIPFDFAIWAEEFPKYCREFHFFLNEGATVDKPPISYAKLNGNCKLHNIGKLQPHWRRALGIGLDRSVILENTAHLDAFIIQGPTPLQIHVAKSTHPDCRIVLLLVGLWKKWPKEMFRTVSPWRERLINLLKKFNWYQTTKLINEFDVIFMGNNPATPDFYRAKKPFHVVSKGLVRPHEIRPPKESNEKATKRLVFYSRLDPEKNVELIIESFAKLRRTHDLELFVCGGSQSKKYLSFLKQRAIDHGVASEVKFLGNIPFDQKNTVFESADIYIFNTCTTEGFPRTIWEAFSHGVPTVCASFPGAREFFSGEEVLIFEQNDADDMAAKIELLISDDKLKRQMVSKAYELLNKNTADKSVIHIAQIIKHELAKP